MGRLSHLTEAELTSDQQNYRTAIIDEWSQRTDILTSEGGLQGPFNPLLRRPNLGRCIADLGHELRSSSVLAPRLKELIVITVGAHLQANYEWHMHSRIAEDSGLHPRIIAAIGDGIEPSFIDASEKATYTFISELLRTNRVERQTYDACVAAIGEPGVVELVVLAGLYTNTCYLLNAFEIPLPDKAMPKWAYVDDVLDDPD